MASERYASGRYGARYNGGAGARPLLWMRVRTVARAIYATSVAAGMMHCSQATLRDWARKLGIHTQGNPADLRERGWTLGELEHIAAAHNRRLGKPPVEPEPSRRMRELEHQVEVLKAAVARLQAHLGLAGALDGQLHPPRKNRPTVRPAKYPKLPAGAVTFRQLVTEYGADERSVRDWIAAGAMPAPTTEGGPWYAGAVVKRIYTAEQIGEARAALGRLTGRSGGTGGAS